MAELRDVYAIGSVAMDVKANLESQISDIQGCFGAERSRG